MRTLSSSCCLYIIRQKLASLPQHRRQAHQAAGKQDFIVRKHTDIITKYGIKKNGTPFYTIIPMHEGMEQFYKHRLHELDLATEQKKAQKTL